MRTRTIAAVLGLCIGAFAVFLWRTGERAAPVKQQTTTIRSTARGADTAGRTHSRPRARPGTGAQLSNGERATRSLLDRASAELRSALADRERFPELFACPDRRARPCQRALSEALRKALIYPVKAGLIERWPGDLDVNSLRRIASETLSTSDDPSVRAPLLVVLDLAGTYLEGELRVPPEAYAQLGSLTDVEQELLLREYGEAAPSERPLRDTVAALASDADEATEVRRSALCALARTGAGADVALALNALRRDGAVNEQWDQAELGRALAQCGSACSESIRSLARSSTANERATALLALTLGNDELRAELLEAVRASLPAPGLRDFSEQDQLRYLDRDPHALARRPLSVVSSLNQ